MSMVTSSIIHYIVSSILFSCPRNYVDYRNLNKTRMIEQADPKQITGTPFEYEAYICRPSPAIVAAFESSE